MVIVVATHRTPFPAVTCSLSAFRADDFVDSVRTSQRLTCDA
jgi:hypothetical protein